MIAQLNAHINVEFLLWVRIASWKLFTLFNQFTEGFHKYKFN